MVERSAEKTLCGFEAEQKLYERKIALMTNPKGINPKFDDDQLIQAGDAQDGKEDSKR